MTGIFITILFFRHGASVKAKKFLFAAAALLLFSGCSATAKRAAQRDGELAESYWRPVKSPVPAYIEFTGDGRMVGAIGNDRFFGPVAYAKGKRLRLGPVAATRNPRAEHRITEFFIARLEKTRGYVLDGDTLTFYDEERRPVMKLLRLKPQGSRP